MKKRNVGEVAATGTSEHLAPPGSVVLVGFPCLVAHCSVVRYDDGSPRKTGWVTLKTQGAAWVVQIKDPDSMASLQAIGATLDDALTLGELLLSSSDAPWEPDMWLRRQAGASKK